MSRPAAPPTAPPRRWQGIAAGIAAAGALVAAALGAAGSPGLAAGWLVAWLFVLSLALGGLFFVLLHHVSRAAWGLVFRRIAETAAATLPGVALLGLPLALALPDLYPWAAEGGAPVAGGRRTWLEPTFFLLRSALYLGTWSGLGLWLWRASRRADAGGDVAAHRRLRAASAPALVWMGASVPFAAFDWVMSLDPDWMSTLFGVVFFAGSMVGHLAFLAVAAIALERGGPLAGALRARHLHDLGKLLLAFVCFWAYVAFSQYLLIWYAAIPEESAWFATRRAGGAGAATIALAVGHFALPFAALLSRAAKRRRSTLAAISAWLLAAHYLELCWLVGPSIGHSFGAADAALLAAAAGAWAALFLALLRRGGALPAGDPRLAEGLGEGPAARLAGRTVRGGAGRGASDRAHGGSRAA